jgi:prepilin-type N-terminal cleavage/methylation domain-containing protein
MNTHPNQISRVAADPRGFTLIELIVAMAVFGIALTGLVPLIAMMSRDLQPVVGQKGQSPARDWNTDDCTITNHRRSTWYLTPYGGDVDPWVRKLGVSARITSSPAASYTRYSNIPLQASVVLQDDDNGTIDADGDGLEDYSEEPTVPWEYNNSTVPSAIGADQHRKPAVAAGGSATGDAVWKFKIVVTGYYSIQATWTAASDNATDVRYSYKINGGATVLCPPVNQSVPPAGIACASDSHTWTSLTGNSLILLAKDAVVEVHLSDVRVSSPDTGKYVVADAIRIVQNTVRIKSVERSLNGTRKISDENPADVMAQVSVTVNLSQ